jgi:hypothetical protein
MLSTPRKILLVLRAECFSPNAVEKDAAVLHAVGRCLESRGAQVEYLREDQLSAADGVIGSDVGAVFTMARSEAALNKLQRAEDDGVEVVNPTRGVRLCGSRRAIGELMRASDIPAAPAYQRGAGWVKSDSGHHVCFAADESAVASLCKTIAHPVVTAHVAGTDLKFYGVADAFFYPSGHPGLRQAAVRLARQAGVSVYGGDAVVRPDGSFVIVDFNDWPSFSPCRDEAAAAISQLV